MLRRTCLQQLLSFFVFCFLLFVFVCERARCFFVQILRSSFIFRILRLNTANADGSNAGSRLVLRWNPLRRRQARFPSDRIEVKPLA